MLSLEYMIFLEDIGWLQYFVKFMFLLSISNDKQNQFKVWFLFNYQIFKCLPISTTEYWIKLLKKWVKKLFILPMTSSVDNKKWVNWNECPPWQTWKSFCEVLFNHFVKDFKSLIYSFMKFLSAVNKMFLIFLFLHPWL